jgi:hypothetical protein
MKRKLLVGFVVFLLFCLVFIIFVVNDFFLLSLPTKVTSDNILKITPGMTLEQVYNILGRPLKVNVLNGIHNISCANPHPTLNENISNKTDIRILVNDFISKQKNCCEGRKRDIEQLDDITLVYTKEGFLSSYPMLWVHLDRSFKVYGIYAKEYEAGLLGDDPSIYSFYWAMDSTCTKYNYTKTDKWINKEKFYRCFK